MRRRHSAGSGSGFTLLELLAVMAIAAVVMSLAVPASVRFFDSMQYRQAVRDMAATLSSARYRAVTSGTTQDVILQPFQGDVRYNGKVLSISKDYPMEIKTAAALNRGSSGVVRFYPDGGSSGADITIAGPGDSATMISVDWLLGGVTLAPYALE
ncbi:MAG: GspH/FimT family pseudopilin [Pseudomonadota bacterium]